MTATPDEGASLHHHRRRMAGRDPHEAHRVATPLELLFDLTFVISFGAAASQLAHALAAGHIGAGLIGFATAAFAICLAWTNFSWFASAYDTDDWPFRVATMVQMAGVLLLGVGMPRLFASIEHGQHLDLAVVVAGYVVMRLAMVLQWLRAATQDPPRRGVALTYAASIFGLQLAWIALAVADPPLDWALATFAVLGPLEFVAPVLAERQRGGTPWHAHHIVERYALFAIIALGEGVVGTVAALSAVIDEQGWTLDAGLVCAAGVGLTFGMWWIYYILPSAAVLHAHRWRAFPWAWTQTAMIVAIVATGAGLHVAAYAIQGDAKIGPLATMLTVAIPVAVFVGGVYALYAFLVRRFDPFHVWLLGGTAAVIAAAVGAAASGVSMALCLIVLTMAPVVTVIGYEARGYRHQVRALAEDGEAGSRP